MSVHPHACGAYAQFRLRSCQLCRFIPTPVGHTLEKTAKYRHSYHRYMLYVSNQRLLNIVFSVNIKNPLSKPLFCNIFSEPQFFLMGLHAVDAALHDDAAVEFQHIEAFLDNVAVAFCCEMLILEFLF